MTGCYLQASKVENAIISFKFQFGWCFSKPDFCNFFVFCTICMCNAWAPQNLHALPVQFVQNNKKYCKRKVYMKHHQNGILKNIMVFFTLANKHWAFLIPTVCTNTWENYMDIHVPQILFFNKLGKNEPPFPLFIFHVESLRSCFSQSNHPQNYVCVKGSSLEFLVEIIYNVIMVAMLIETLNQQKKHFSG